MFVDELFPTDVAVETSGGPTFDVDVVVKSNGEESRNLNSEDDRWKGDCSQGIKQPKRYIPFRKFFLKMRGMFYSFRYLDPLDNTIEAHDSDFIPIDATHSYLGKSYGDYTKKITKPIPGSFVPNGGSGLSLDYSTGILTHDEGGLPDSFTCGWHRHVRFNTNEMLHLQIDKNKKGPLVDWKPIPMIELLNEED